MCSVVAESERQNGIPSKRVFQKLAMALGAKVIAPMVTGIDILLMCWNIVHPFQHLVRCFVDFNSGT